jgi:hypothetical protein
LLIILASILPLSSFKLIVSIVGVIAISNHSGADNYDTYISNKGRIKQNEPQLELIIGK